MNRWSNVPGANSHRVRHPRGRLTRPCQDGQGSGPRREGNQRRRQSNPLLAEPILHPGRDFGIDRPSDGVVLGRFSQSPGHVLAADTLDRVPNLVESADREVPEQADRRKRPSSAGRAQHAPPAGSAP